MDAPIGRVWDELAALETHVEWMADAATLDFLTDQRRGVGTIFECLTKVGPLSTRDRMRVTEWDEGHAIGVHHEGLVTGTGRFTLRRSARAPRRRTVVTWQEELNFPWYLGGPVGAVAAKPALRYVWRGNLRRLASRVA
jgi:hypothetical protein